MASALDGGLGHGAARPPGQDQLTPAAAKALDDVQLERCAEALEVAGTQQDQPSAFRDESSWNWVAQLSQVMITGAPSPGPRDGLC